MVWPVVARSAATEGPASRGETVARGKTAPTADDWTRRGRHELDQRRWGRALRRFNRALKLNPAHAPAYVGRGNVFEARGRLDEAANEYQAARLADPTDADAQSAWARVRGTPTTN